MSKKRRAKIPPFRVLNSENIFRKFVSKIMRSCDKNFAQLHYDYYFQGAINLKKEYRKYYRKEFCSVEKFIEEHFNIELDDAKKLAEGNYSMKECSRCSVERNIETLNYDESFKKAFSKAIGGLEDEDQDGIYYE